MVDWDEDNSRRLVGLWADGMSAALIADQIPGATKNSIIGRAHTMRLSARPSPLGHAYKPAAVRPVPTPRDLVLAPLPIPVPPPAHPKPVIVAPVAVAAPPPPVRSAVHRCQWLNGVTRGAYVQCETRTAALGSPWCPAHLRRVFLPARRAGSLVSA